MTAYSTTLDRLARLSVDHHTHAGEVEWDDPAYVLDPADPRLELPAAFDPLAATDWFRALPSTERSRLGLYRYASAMKTGWQFENLLQRGLLRHAMLMPDNAPEFRYLHHEVAEESEHTAMFFEFIRRSAQPVKGMPHRLRRAAEWFALPMARRFPALFFLLVLGGEEPVDLLQRRHLREVEDAHPLVDRLMRVHVAEEARHLSFARHYLTQRVPTLSRTRRRVLAYAAPLILALMARLMVLPPWDLVREFAVPRDVVTEARRSPLTRQTLKDSVARSRRLWHELGLVTWTSRQVWKAVGLWDDDQPEKPAPPGRQGAAA